jgi:hypothetical protein
MTKLHFTSALPIILLMSAVPAFLALWTASLPVCFLEIAHAEDGSRVFLTTIAPGNRFSLGYTHSVQLSRVTDEFEIDRDFRIILVSVVFSDHGAGLPYDLRRGESFSVQKDGDFTVSKYVRFSEIPLRVGSEYDNTFAFGSYYINLSKTCGNSLLTIRTRQCSALKYFFYMVEDLV